MWSSCWTASGSVWTAAATRSATPCGASSRTTRRTPPRPASACATASSSASITPTAVAAPSGCRASMPPWKSSSATTTSRPDPLAVSPALLYCDTRSHAGRQPRETTRHPEEVQVMINHVWGLFTRPNSEWQEIRGEEQSSHPRIYALFVLAAIPPVSAFIGTTRVGWAHGNAPAVRLTEASALPLAVFSYLAMLAGVVVMGWFIHWMARTYHANPTLRQCVMFAAYTATPLFFAGLAALYPNLWLAMLVGTAAVAYTAYLLYVGLPTFMG